MSIQFPIRSESHQQEEMSERFFRECLPRNWTAEKPANDYGVDLRVDLFEGKRATGQELLVQLKAAKAPTGDNCEKVSLRVATYNLLWHKLQVAMLVKFVESENEGYWVLFKDIPSPSQDKKTFTVHIPKANRLSTAPWAAIQQYVERVTDRKLAAMRVHEINRIGEGD